MLLYMVQPELSTSEKFEFVQNYFQRMAGGMPVGFQNTVGRSTFRDCESPPDLLVREGVFGSEPRPCLLHEREQMLPKVSKFPLLGVSLKSQGAQHHQGLCRHQDNPRLLLSTLLPRDDHGEHVSQDLKSFNIQNIAQVSDGGHSGQWGDLSGHLREGSRQ